MLSHPLCLICSFKEPCEVGIVLRLRYVKTVFKTWWLGGKESVCQAGDVGLISELGRSPGEGNGNPLQYSCLVNPMDRGAWQTTVHGVAKELDTT